jgi:hypothetical protein
MCWPCGLKKNRTLERDHANNSKLVWDAGKKGEVIKQGAPLAVRQARDQDMILM